MSWYGAFLWGLRPDVTSYRSVAVWNLRSYFCEAPSLARGRVCNLQCNHSMVRVAQNPQPYFTVSSKTPPTLRARSPYLYPPGTGWPSYTPGHWVPFTSSLTTRLWWLAGLRWRYLTLSQPGGPGPRIYFPQELVGQVQSPKSKSRYDRGQSISMSWSLVHAALE
jgi:hypothetical protein